MSTVEDVYRDTVWQPLIAPHELNLTPTPPSLDEFSPKRQLTHSVVGIVLSLGVPVNMTLGIWPHYHSQMVQLFQEGWKWGVAQWMTKLQVGGYKVFALPFRFVVETSRKWQTNRVNVLSLAFSRTGILSPLNKGSQHTSSLCQVG